MSMNGPSEHISEDFIRFFRTNHLLQGQFLVAVSGGIDSAVLCALCHRAGLAFSIAHCNFQLRGEESDRDERFVRALAERYEVEIFVQRFETQGYADRHKMSIQEAAREQRYDWFLRLKKEKGFSFTLLAHHADDNIETLMMNFFRGTGLQGLTGMPEISHEGRFILRPLLAVRRKELEEYAAEQGLTWIEDSSNSLSKYTRNFFRNDLLPSIRKAYPQAEDNLLDNIERFKRINALYRMSVEELKKKVCVPYESEIRIPVLKIVKYQDTSLVYEIIKDYGFGEKQVQEVIRLAHGESGRFIQNEKCQIIRHRNWLIIAPRAENAATVVIEKTSETARFTGGQLEIRSIPKEKFQLQKTEDIAQVDAKHVEFPLLLRRWRQGDYFYPLGMRKKKKLARFFIDRKLSKHQKENTWVLESDKKIVWVVGLRIDDRFKVTDATQTILRISLTSP